MTREKKLFISGLSIGCILGIIALVIFNDLSFILGGIGIMIIGFSLMYYLVCIRKN